MAYTEVSITGYNANPPSDDGTEEAQNEVSWGKHKTKIGDPLKNAIEAINTNVKSFSDESPSGQSGTRMVFQQTSAPTGWTKETGAGFNDVAMRIVTGAVGSETGQQAFSTVFGKTATDGHALAEAQLPTIDMSTKLSPSVSTVVTDVGASTGAISGADIVSGSGVLTSLSEDKASLSISGSLGSDEAHSHDMDIRLNRQDAIVAAKD